MRSLHWEMQIKGAWVIPQQAFCNAKIADVYTSALLAGTMCPFSPHTLNYLWFGCIIEQGDTLRNAECYYTLFTLFDQT